MENDGINLMALTPLQFSHGSKDVIYPQAPPMLVAVITTEPRGVVEIVFIAEWSFVQGQLYSMPFTKLTSCVYSNWLQEENGSIRERLKNPNQIDHDLQLLQSAVVVFNIVIYLFFL